MKNPNPKLLTLDECFAAVDSAERSGATLTPDLLYRLSMAIENGEHGLVEDHERAVSLCMRAAEGGHGPACVDLASLTPDFGSEQSRSWLRRAVDAGDVDAMTYLGLTISMDEENSEEGRALIEKAVMRLEPRALSYEAVAELDKSEPDMVKGRLYAALALSEGCLEFEPYVHVFFNEEDCKEEDRIDFSKAIADGVAAGIPLADYAAILLNPDRSASGDLDEATLTLLRRAATAGIPDAIERLALDALGRGDYDKAAELFEEPVSMHMPQSLCTRGLMYMVGDGPVKDPERGIRLISEAINSGYAPAQMIYSEIVTRHPEITGGLNPEICSQFYSYLATIQD